MHRRLRPRAHRFYYRVFWLLLDLDEIDELATRSRTAISTFASTMAELMALAAGGAPADAVREAALTKSGYLTVLESSTDPQDETRVENLAELVAVAREFVAAAATLEEGEEPDPDVTLAAGSLDAFLEAPAAQA